MQVLYIDNHLCVVVKSPGIPTQPTLVEQAKAWIKRKYQKPGNVFLEPIHRLDQPVGGLVLLARTSKALSRLQEMMRNHQIQRTYYAWVEKPLKESDGILEHQLLHDDHIARVVTRGGKLAKLSYRTLLIKKGRALLEIELETGRYHQIRAQLSAEKSPILGDQKYGSKIAWEDEGIALHHGKLGLIHPVTLKLQEWKVGGRKGLFPPPLELPRGSD